VRQEVESLVATDFDPLFVHDANRRMNPEWKFECIAHNIIDEPLCREFDGAYALDVIEHIDPANEDRFIANIVRSIGPHGVCIVGAPSLESQAYASPGSKAGHINCKSALELRNLMLGHFHNVFMFSMNDEVVHTGYFKMAHYLFALGCAKR
jgi:hypothetical protein